MSQLSHPNVAFYKPQLKVPKVGEKATIILSDFTIWVTTPVVATFNIPGRGLAILTEDYLYLPNMRGNE